MFIFCELCSKLKQLIIGRQPKRRINSMGAELKGKHSYWNSADLLIRTREPSTDICGYKRRDCHVSRRRASNVGVCLTGESSPEEFRGTVNWDPGLFSSHWRYGVLFSHTGGDGDCQPQE